MVEKKRKEKKRKEKKEKRGKRKKKRKGFYAVVGKVPDPSGFFFP